MLSETGKPRTCLGSVLCRSTKEHVTSTCDEQWCSVGVAAIQKFRIGERSAPAFVFFCGRTVTVSRVQKNIHLVPYERGQSERLGSLYKSNCTRKSCILSHIRRSLDEIASSLRLFCQVTLADILCIYISIYMLLYIYIYIYIRIRIAICVSV